MKLRLFTCTLAIAGIAAPALAQSNDSEGVAPEVVVEEKVVEEMVIIEPAIFEQITIVDGDEERLKREILREVDKRLAKQLDALRRDIRKMLTQRQGQRQAPNFSTPRAPQAPLAPQAPRARLARPVPGERRARTYVVTRDGHAKIRIEVNGKVIEKIIPLGESFELNLPGGKVWVKTDGHGTKARAHANKSASKSAKKSAHKKMFKRDSKSSRDFDFDFDGKGDRDEMRRKMQRFLKEHGGEGERGMREFGQGMQKWGEQFQEKMQKQMHERMQKQMHERMRRGRGEGRGESRGEGRGQLPDLHRQLQKLMGDLDPTDRRQVERAMKELHGLLDQGAQGEKRAKKQAKKRAKKQAPKRHKKAKRQMEEESF